MWLSGRYIDFAVLSQERVELTLVSHNNFPRNGSKFLENTTARQNRQSGRICENSADRQCGFESPLPKAEIPVAAKR